MDLFLDFDLPSTPVKLHAPLNLELPSPDDVTVQSFKTVIENELKLGEGEFSLLPFQEAAWPSLLKPLLDGKQGSLLLAAPGTGKTYTCARVVRELASPDCPLIPSILRHREEMGEFGEPIYKVIIITVSAAIVQWQRVLATFGLPDGFARVISYPDLRSTVCDGLLVNWEKTPKGEIPVWNDTRPCLIILDECQYVKNSDSQVGQIVKSAFETGVKMIASSATPFVKLVEAEVVMRGLGLGVDNWNDLMWSLAARGKNPSDRSPKSMENLRDYIDRKGQLVKHTNVRFKFDTKINCVVETMTAEQREEYDAAYQKYLEERAKLDLGEPSGIRALWVAMAIFMHTAEMLRVPNAVARILKGLAEGKQVIFAANHVDVLERVQAGLEKADPSLKISVLVGGQSPTVRQVNVDRFQNGTNSVCLLTLKTGGVALSLHHDRPTTRPRKVVMPPCWSPFMLVQALYRAHRITSLSETEQDILWFAGTIEDRVKERCEQGTKCLSKFLTKKDGLVEVFLEESDREKVVEVVDDEFSVDLGEDEDDILDLSVLDVDAFNNK